MTTSPKKPKNRSQEAFSIRNGRKVDDHIHGPILDNPEAEKAAMERYPDLLKEIGLSDEDITSIMDRMSNRSSEPNIEGFARGGPGSAPWNVRRPAHPRQPAGMIKSEVPGRTDKLKMSVPSGSYIIPADIPSALGEGNTMAGEKILGSLFKSGPYSPGSTGALSGKLPKAKSSTFKMPAMRKPKSLGKTFAEGGETPDVPIIAAGGEYVLHPEQVQQIGHGDLSAGHRVLDKLVLGIRKKNIETLKKLKPPKK